MGIFGGLQAEQYDRVYDDGYLLRRMGNYLSAQRRRVISITGLVIFYAIMGSLIPLVIAEGVEALSSAAPDLTVWLLVGALFAVGIIDFGIYWLRRRLTARVVADVVSDLRKDAFTAAIDRDLSFYDDVKSGKVVSRITSDTQELNTVLVIGIDLISQVLDFLILFVVLLTREWRLTLMLVGVMPVIFGMTIVLRHFARIVTRQGTRAMAAVNDNIQESVSGISVAKNYRQEAMIYRDFTAINRQSYNINIRRGFVLATVFPSLNAVSGFIIGGLLYIGASYVLGGVLTVGMWYLFIQGVDRFWFPVINLSGFWSQLQAGLSAVERIFALVDAENTLKQTDDQPAPAHMHGEIVFKDVIFEYKNGERVLDRFNIHIQPGESIAFVGHTGAGKSTIAKAVARFYEFQGGTILVDGQDIRTFNLQSYRSKLGIVPQQPFLFSGTIRDNIRYARPDATDAEIEEIANSIGSGEWLETLPDGLDSDVGERGARLSMGQRQLVSLLRVLVQKPAIFILDEATASIDPFTETQIQEALDLILKQSTSILIAHRLSTVRSADRIIVLKNGGIIEQGNHEQLMQQRGHYAELYNTYFRHQSLEYVENARKYADTQEMEKAGSV
ncbi:MAG: ABC transporter ATP-binding protein [Anaerolinea sp.]|nr:ABC transporter ATP-binding protein [Anaerolinea sp.]